MAVVALLTILGIGTLGMPATDAAPRAGPSGATATIGPAPPGAVMPRAGPAPARPAPAIAVAIAGETPTAISLSWGATQDFFFSSYSIEYSSNGSAGPFQTVGVVTSQSTTEYAASGLSPGASYSWRVVETGTLGSQVSAAISATQPTLAFLNVTEPTSSSATFNWTNNATYGGLLSFGTYTLYESVGGAPPSAVATETGPARTTTTLSDLSSGSSYLFLLNTTDCASGCSGAGGTSFSSESNPVTFGTPLPLVASLSALRPVVDAGQPDLFTCTPSGGSSPFHFAWTVGNGSPEPGAGSVSFAFPAPGPVQVGCEITDADRSESRAALPVVVDGTPSVQVELNRTAADVGQLVDFSCLASGGTAPYTLEWTFGDGVSLSGAAIAHAYAGPGQYTPTCRVSDAVDAQVATSANLSVSLDPTLRVSASSGAAAPGSTIAFTAVPGNGTGRFPSVNWSFGDGATATTLDASHSFAAPGNYSATARVIDSNGVAAADNVRVVVARIEVVITLTSTSLRVGASTTFRASAVGGAGNFSFQWEFGDGSIASGASVDHTYTRSSQFHPTLLVTDGLGATNRSAAPVVTVSPPPAPPSWLPGPLILLFGVVIAVATGTVVLVLGRRRAERFHRSVAGYVPPVAPGRTAQPVKICQSCGTGNMALRDTCTNCGAALPSLLS